MILDLYAQDIESGIQRQLVNPDPPPPIPFELWSFTGAGAKGVPKGLTELGANALDAVAGVAEIGSDSLPPEKRQRAKERSDAIRTMGESVRAKAKDFTVDPETSHQADVVINNLSSTVTQAVASVAVAGVGAGSLVFGASTGYQTYMDLLKKGVDKNTAMKVAGVTGVVNAAGVVVPIGSATRMGTAGLVALSGPGAYMLQEKVSKDILQHAGYEKEALTHDPFDPLGLTISTVLPAVFGAAHALRLSRVPKLEDVVKHIESGGRRYGKDGKLLTSPKGAQGEMQVMPYTASDPGFGVVPARDSSPDELARVGRDYLDAMVKRYGDRDKALAAYNAGPGAVDNAIKEAGDGWLSRMPVETQKYVGKANRMLGDAVAQRATPEAVDAARVKVADEALMKSMPDHPEAVSRVASAADEVAAGRIPDVGDMPVTRFTDVSLDAHNGQINAELTAMRGDAAVGRIEYTVFEGRPQISMIEVDPQVRRQGVGTELVQELQRRFPDQEIEWGMMTDDGARLRESLPQIAEPVPEVQAKARELDAAIKERTALEVKAADMEARPANERSEWIAQVGPRWNELHDRIDALESELRGAKPVKSLIDTRRPGRPSSVPPETSVSIEPETPPTKPADSLDTERIQTLIKQNPDLPVKLPGTDETMTLKAALQRYIDEADIEMKQADLVRAAVECALGG